MSSKRDDEDSRAALLEKEQSSPRFSLDELDTNEHDTLVGSQNEDKQHARETTVARAYETKSSLRLWRFRLPSRTCLITTAILLTGLLGVLLASGYFVVYKIKPPDGESPPWYPSPRGGTAASWQQSYAKAATLVRRMSLVEKVNVTTGVGWAGDLCVGNTGPASNAGFPALCLQDGPLGIRFADHATNFPAGITVAATWNRDLMNRRGRAQGKEMRLKGVNVLLGPSMGPLGRMPAGGRNWEGFSPDPVLAGIAAAETIKGIQAEGVMATAKHLVGNEQEHFRQQWEWGVPNALSSNIDDRTLHELYLWPFAESVRAGVASVMCSYNMVNNSFACGNSKLLNGILKDELGFQGFVQSDWLAQRSGVGSALAGLDMSMPGDGLGWSDGKSLWGDQLTIAVLNGSVPMGRLDDAVTRIVAAWYQLGQDDTKKWPRPPPEGDGGPNFSSWTDKEVDRIYWESGEDIIGVVNKFVDVQGTGDDFHGRLAKEIAAEGIVLVKNEKGLLPLSRTGFPDSNMGKEKEKYKVGIFGEDAGPNPKGPNACPDRACNVGTLASGWGSGAAEFPYLVTPLKALQSNYDFDAVNLTIDLENKVPKSQVLKDQNLCLVFANSDSGEGFSSWAGIKGDRNDLFLQKSGMELISGVADSCGGPTVAIIHAVGPTLLDPWIDHANVHAVLLAHLPGQESGNALASVLFGDVDASGRLPYTIGKSLADYGPAGQIMYRPNGLVPQQDFTEGLLIDYRHFDARGIAPRFPFGFGLSYTRFEYSNLTITTVKPKSALPAARPSSTDDAIPPTFDAALPDPSTALFPPDFHKIRKRIYPYLRDVAQARPSTKPYPYPQGYNVSAPRSPAGGAPGGNPALYDTHLSVSFTVTNSGAREGAEVAQLYVEFPADEADERGVQVEFPLRVLRAFEKVRARSGESKRVVLELTRRDLSWWSPGRGNWVMPLGEFGVVVGGNVGERRLEGKW